MAKRELVLWGFHPKHQPTPIKLAKWSRSAQSWRESLGWTCGVYAQGDEPKALRLLAQGVPVATVRDPAIIDAFFGGANGPLVRAGLVRS